MSCPNGTVYNCTLDEETAFWQRTSYIFTIVMGIVGNSIIISVLFFGNKSRLNRLEIFLLHIALADIFVAILNTLPQLLDQLYCITFLFSNDFVCKLMKFLQMAPPYASTYILMICSIDRYLAIAYPLTSRRLFSGENIHMMAGIGWVLGLIVATPQLFIFGYTDKDKCSEFMSADALIAYVEVLFIFAFLIPLVILIACNSAMCVVLCRGVNFLELSGSGRSSDGNQNDGDTATSCRQNSIASFFTGSHRRRCQRSIAIKNTQLSRRRAASLHKSVRMTLIVCFLYMICWTPFFCSQLHWALNPKITECTINFAMIIAVQMSGLNSCCNPWVYGFFAIPKMFKRHRPAARHHCSHLHNRSTVKRGSSYSKSTTTSYLLSDHNKTTSTTITTHGL